MTLHWFSLEGVGKGLAVLALASANSNQAVDPPEAIWEASVGQLFGNFMAPFLRIKNMATFQKNRESPPVISDGGVSAENGGFEPPRAFTQRAFQARAIGH